LTNTKSIADLKLHRSQYVALTDKTYFNYGGQGVMCQSALAAIAKSYAHIESLGCFSGAANDWANAEAAKLRAAIATEFNVTPQTITLTENTTAGCNIALWSFDWQKGDRLLLSDCEHPGIFAIASELQARFGIEVDIFSLQATLNGDGDLVDAIAQHLQPRTRMLGISHICWNTGQVLPLQQIARLCHAHNVLVVVDAAQSVGVLPLDLAKIAVDFYAFTGHKWWCGPLGVGGLYIRPQAFTVARPTFIGWRSIKSWQLPTDSSESSNLQDVIRWQPNGQKFEVASSNYPLYTSLRKAIAEANQWGTQQQRYDRICELSRSLWHELGQIPGIECLKTSAPEAGLVSFTIEGRSPSQVMSQFESEQNIFIRSIPNPNCLRASVHYLTTKDEIATLLEALTELVDSE
jgi:L-cysteine/cystine lyase